VTGGTGALSWSRGRPARPDRTGPSGIQWGAFLRSGETSVCDAGHLGVVTNHVPLERPFEKRAAPSGGEAYHGCAAGSGFFCRCSIEIGIPPLALLALQQAQGQSGSVGMGLAGSHPIESLVKSRFLTPEGVRRRAGRSPGRPGCVLPRQARVARGEKMGNGDPMAEAMGRHGAVACRHGAVVTA